MARRLTSLRRLRQPVACAVVAAVLWAGTALCAVADEFQQLVDQAVRAQEAGNLSAAAEKYTEAAALAPGNVEVLFRLALVQGYLGEYAAALETTDKGLAIDPRNTDLRLARSRILGWSGRYAEARRTVNAVIAEQPQNAEAHTVKGRIEFYDGRLDSAHSAFAEARRLDPGNAEAAAGLADVARARTGDETPRWQIDTGYLHSRFSRVDLADWREGFIRIEHRWPSNTALSFRVDTSNRFSETETSVGVGIAQRFNAAVYGYLEGSMAPAADFLPRSMVAAGGSLRILKNEGVIGDSMLTATLRHRRYATGDVQNIEPGIQQYAFDGRLWLAAKWVNAFDREADTRLAGWYGRVDWQVAQFLRVYGGLSDMPETESGVTVETRSQFGGLAVDLTPNIRLNIDLAREDRANSYVRNVYGLGATLRF